MKTRDQAYEQWEAANRPALCDQQCKVPDAWTAAWDAARREPLELLCWAHSTLQLWATELDFDEPWGESPEWQRLLALLAGAPVRAAAQEEPLEVLRFIREGHRAADGRCRFCWSTGRPGRPEWHVSGCMVLRIDALLAEPDVKTK